MGLSSRLALPTPKVIGKRLCFKPVQLNDSQFIVSLRNDSKLNSYLNANKLITVESQDQYIINARSRVENYWIISTLDRDEAIGCLRAYDEVDSSISWGSWIIKPGQPAFYSIESARLVYWYFIRQGFSSSHFCVSKGNSSVLKFHLSYGAKIIQESVDEYFLKVEFTDIRTFVHRDRSSEFWKLLV